MARGPTERRRGQVCPVGFRHSKSTHTRTYYPKWYRRPFCPWRNHSGSEPGSRAPLAVCSLATGLLDHPSQGRQGPHGAPAWVTGTSALTSHHLFSASGSIFGSGPLMCSPSTLSYVVRALGAVCNDTIPLLPSLRGHNLYHIITKIICFLVCFCHQTGLHLWVPHLGL